VYDLDHRRVSVFGADGSLVREMTLPQEADAGFPSAIGVLGEDLLVQAEEFAHRSAESGPRRDSVPVFRYVRWEAPAALVGRYPGSETYVSVASSGGQIRSVMSTMMPFGLRLTLDVAGDRLYVGSGEQFEIAAYDGTGRLTRLIRRFHSPDPVTEADVAATKRDRLSGFRIGSEAIREKVRSILEAMTFPSTKPAYAGFVAGENGHLWVRQYDPPAREPQVRYDVFDPDGQWLGHVGFPSNFYLHQAGADYALGVWRDADEVEYVRLYKFRTPR